MEYLMAPLFECSTFGKLQKDLAFVLTLLRQTLAAPKPPASKSQKSLAGLAKFSSLGSCLLIGFASHRAWNPFADSVFRLSLSPSSPVRVNF